MGVPVTLKKLHSLPDSSRVIARFFKNGQFELKDKSALVFSMSETERVFL